jgi:hypothetical protein
VQRTYNDQLQRKLAGTVWNSGGCKSWYLDASRRNTTLWPSFTFAFRRPHPDLQRGRLPDQLEWPRSTARDWLTD